MSVHPAALAALIDHTLLKPEATRDDVRRLGEAARQHGLGAVCVNPTWVAFCREILTGSGVRVVSVVGFPFGATLAEVKALEARRVIEAGAAEVDMVMNVGAFRSGDLAVVRAEIGAVLAACRAGGARLKVIIEAGALAQTEKAGAAELVRDTGADWIKTSTGYGPGGATVEDVVLLRRLVGPGIGVKAAGGIRTLAQALALLEAGATRLGTSRGVQLVEEAQALLAGPGSPR